MRRNPAILVLCDLDDTLFNSETPPRTSDARQAFGRLAQADIPIVFSSSKTRAELELIQQQLEIDHPFICENGAAVFVPRRYFGFNIGQDRDIVGYEVAEFGKPYAEIVPLLRRAAGRLRIDIVGFSDQSVEEVAADRGLSLLQARLAKLREYNEPFRVVDNKPEAVLRLFKMLRASGVACTSRADHHYAGTISRGIGAHFLRGLYRRAFGDTFILAFGDHRSAVPLLREADMPLVVQSTVSEEAAVLLGQVPRARLSVADSIDSWAHAILEIAEAVRTRSPCPS